MKHQNHKKLVFNSRYSMAKQKNIINRALARLGSRDKIALILDGSQLGTSKSLTKFGWNVNRIHIPNFSKDYEIIKKRFKGRHFNLTLNDYLQNYSQQDKYGLIYADYMVCLDGNKHCNPLIDIGLIFNDKCLCDGACLAVTINMRNQHGSNKWFTSNDVQRLISFVTTKAIDNGYVAILEPNGGTYKNGGTMHTSIFKIYKL